MEVSRDLSVIAEPTVLVCGAGSSGVAAALTAARSGLSTMVVDSAAFSGGFITNVVGPTLDGAFDVVTGELAVGGLVLEILDKVCDIAPTSSAERFVNGGDIPVRDPARLKKHVDYRGKTRVLMDVERFKLFADAAMRQANVDVLYHTMVCGVVRNGTRIDAIILANKAGLSAVRAKYVIDCTGDADVVAWAGAPTRSAAGHQPMTLHFRMGNVAITDTLVENCSAVLAEAAAAGQISSYGGPWMLQLGPGDVTVNATRLQRDRTDPSDWTHAEMEGRVAAWAMFSLWKSRVPECQEAYYIVSGPECGARETRQIVGEYVLTARDVVNRNHFTDAVVKGAWYIDQHQSDVAGFHQHREVRPYDIPYRTLLPLGLSNVLVAGRCHSAEPEALASSRVTATAIGMGQAAATAVALSAHAGGAELRQVDARELRGALVDQGAVLD